MRLERLVRDLLPLPKIEEDSGENKKLIFFGSDGESESTTETIIAKRDKYECEDPLCSELVKLKPTLKDALTTSIIFRSTVAMRQADLHQ